MAGFFKRAMVYLGLVDDEYEDYEDYEPRGPVGTGISTRAVEGEDEEPAPVAVSTSTIRPLPRDDGGSGGQVTTITPRPAVRPVSAAAAADAGASARVHVVQPVQFGDARHIADRLMSNQPVIVNLQVADQQLMRRMIDFCSGVAYALSGKMERVADKVFLVTPSNVKVSAEERQRLQENGLLRP
ncbi:MAG TPA: cell division protein SepF [Acidimicrobiales bacterium]|nr:cell division protein SepF [Acidimicrobiales bacterium]